MAGETAALVTPPSGSTFIAGHAARASQIERVRQNTAVQFRKRYVHHGGNETDGHTGTAYARLRNTARPQLCEEDYRGLTVTAVVLVRVVSGGTVRIRLRNLTDGSDVGEMSAAVSDTTIARYTFACTLPSGTTPKNCEWQIVVSDATKPGFGASVGLEFGL